jgi:hypothetical protein
MNIKFVKIIFIIAALYDGILGLAFLFFSGPTFQFFEVTPPDHLSYVQFPAILLLIFAALFYRVAMDPIGNRFIIPYGIALKIGYSSLVFYYVLTTGIAAMWVPWAWADLVFLIAFVICWNFTRSLEKTRLAES